LIGRYRDTLISTAKLASMCRDEGQWKESEELEVQVMETFKEVLESEHLDLLTSIKNRVSTLKGQGTTAGLLHQWKIASS
jgi:hypothetical protein